MSFPTLARSLFVGAAALACAAHASASLLVQEPFTYANGSLSGKSGGTGFSTNWGTGTNGTGAWTVSNDAAVIAGNGSTWAYRSVNAVTSSSFYFSFDFSVNTLALGSSTNFVDALVFSVGGTSFYIGGHYYSYGYNVVASSPTASSSSQTAQTLSSTSTSANVTYAIVGYYSFDSTTNTATLSLWLNPTDATNAATYSVSWTATAATLSTLTLQRYDTNSVSGTNSSTVDGILIGTTWADVTASAVPEPGTYAAIAGALALGAAFWRRLRR